MENLNWIRHMRIKQGLKGFQLAERMQVSAARISMLEKDETRGAVTLKMMVRAAAAMGCKFEYRIVPIVDKPISDLKTAKPRYRIV